jgi:hypothetical protein
MIKLDLKPPDRVLRQFAWIAAIGFPLLAAIFTRGGISFWQPLSWNWTHPVVLALGGLGLLQLVLCLVGFRALTLPLYVVMTLIAFPIGFVLSHVLIALIYYLVFTPMALVFRLIGRDAMNRKLDPDMASYWHARGAPRPPSSYFKLY